MTAFERLFIHEPNHPSGEQLKSADKMLQANAERLQRLTLQLEIQSRRKKIGN